ncbi:FAD-dependent monooxygenase [Actinomadura luteofluorescens]|uniref:FAD-dependent monooxygenase n=1 Tax=Actinomadura luteofluorescens TaxID=46163 RepID=UPI00348D62F2
MDTSVIIVGGGPVGLMLAGELRLGGVDVVVYERRLTRGEESRGVGFTARATELFEHRGLLARLGEVEISRQGHFGGIPLDFGVLEGSHFGARGIPQYRIEKLLEEWVRELGGQVLRGHGVVDLRADDHGVTAVVDGPGGRVERTARYLVGCDGGHSTVRRLAGFEFPGTDATREMYLADVVGAGVRPRPIGERVDGGMVMSGPLEKDVDRVIVCPVGAPPREERDVTFAEVADAWERLTGESLHGARARWVSTFTDATRQVTRYRLGRVLLAGDAAHIHLPAGGQGLSVGVQDAANLGWKLAATVAGRAPEGLLDTYHAERHPVGARVLRNTLAQGTLYLSGAEIEPMRAVMTELMALPEVGRHLSGMVSGLDIRYDVGCSGHPLIGTRMPDGEVRLSGGRRARIKDLLPASRGALIGHFGPGGPERVAAGWADRVDAIAVQGLPASPDRTTAVLVRPDGYVAWAAPGAGDPEQALRRWFGAPHSLKDAQKETARAH